jgi:hypothetical protein
LIVKSNGRHYIGGPFFSASVPNYVSWKEQSRFFHSLDAFSGTSLNLTGSGEP